MQPLTENPRLGLKRKNPALHPGHHLPNFTAAIGDSWSVASETRWSHEMGRFLSPDYNEAGDDPDPVPYADLANPQSLNLYGYVGNNPISRRDENGHVCDQGAVVNGVFTFSCVNSPQMDEGAVIAGDNGLGLFVGAGLGKLAGMGIEAAIYARTTGEVLGPALEGGTDALIGLNPAERKVAQELIAQGHKVSVISRSSTKTADFLVDGIKTELKTLQSAGTNTLKNAIQTAAKQSDQNILIDARNVDISAGEANSEILRAQGNVGNLSGRVTVLTKDGAVKF
jgi:hypothetical protein